MVKGPHPQHLVDRAQLHPAVVADVGHPPHEPRTSSGGAEPAPNRGRIGDDRLELELHHRRMASMTRSVSDRFSNTAWGRQAARSLTEYEPVATATARAEIPSPQ